MNDVQAISGRIKNLIAREDLALSPAGVVLFNSYTLFLKQLYDFANYLPLPYSVQLEDMFNSSEDLPRNVIQLSTPKKEDDDG